nr:hypothetical protein [Tanacetum cinerariifolium]
MAFVVNSVLTYGVDPVLEKEFASFALQVLKIHSLINQLRILTMILQTLSTHHHKPSHTLMSYVEMIITKNSFNAIIPDLPTEEPDNSLSMGDEHLSTISETESNEVIKFSVEDLVPIPSESEGIFDDTRDVPFCDNSPHLDVLNDHFELFSDLNNDCTSSDDDSFEDIDYVEASPPDSELIKALNDNLTPDCVVKSPSPFPISLEDNDSFFEKSDTSLSYSDDSLPEFETLSDHTEETSSGSTTTHADNSLPEYDSLRKIF